jgi:A/G-specific adenine glycosylase
VKVPTSSRPNRPGTDHLGRLDERARGRFRAALLAWFEGLSRPLHIRSATDPWAVLVAEVMAQQTQIARADEAWVVFMARFARPADLAAAPTADVLRAWAGLGYNRRAVALQRAAAVIVDEWGGQIPASVAALEALPGVGPYTSRAVLAIACRWPVAAVDTNVRRVVTRLVGERLSPRDLQATADGLVDAGDPARWTHASMDIGATVCRGRRPLCGACPVRAWCASADRVEVVGLAAHRSGDSGSASDPGSHPRSRPAVPFEQTRRWLRGRIVARLRELEADDWTQVSGPIGSHGPEGVEAALAALERDGLVERRRDGAVRLPSGT